MGDKKRDTDRKFMLEVIATYESLPALWKIKSDEYMNRDKKADAYNVLLQKYKEHFPAATLDELKKSSIACAQTSDLNCAKWNVVLNQEQGRKTCMFRVCGILTPCCS